MSFALQPTSIIPVNVTDDWSVATNAAYDCAVALHQSFPGVFVFPAADVAVVTLVQVQSGATVKGTLSVAATTGVGTWSHAFATTPAIGSVVYLIDMY